MDVESGQVATVRMTADTPLNDKRVRGNMAAGCTVGFNSLAYDIPMICAALAGFDNAHLKALSDKLIKAKQPWQVIRNADINTDNSWDHIDIMSIAPGQSSLKLYAGRLGAPCLQDLPYEPDTVLTTEQMDEVERYCINDLRLTAALYQHLLPQIELRRAMSEQYGIDLRSKGDAQIAEAVLSHELRAAGIRVERPRYKDDHTFRYTAPSWIRFDDPDLLAILESAKQATFSLDESGAVQMPADLITSVSMNGATYTIGIGGLHSCEKGTVVEAGEGEYLIDFDVASYYPSIILGDRLFPDHLGQKFLDVYREVFVERLRAKARVKEIQKEISALEKQLNEIGD